ncbi:MAG: hypothetical protein ABFD98_11810 [Syntrophobacteraceae bacterium]
MPNPSCFLFPVAFSTCREVTPDAQTGMQAQSSFGGPGGVFAVEGCPLPSAPAGNTPPIDPGTRRLYRDHPSLMECAPNSSITAIVGNGIFFNKISELADMIFTHAGKFDSTPSIEVDIKVRKLILDFTTVYNSAWDFSDHWK